MMLLELTFLLCLVLANGVFAMSELAVVSSRTSRLRQMGERGDGGAVVALGLAEDPGRFLATVQVGITMIGVLAGAFGGATFADKLGTWLDTFPAIEPYGGMIGIGVVVIVVTYLTIVVGELVPKRVALADPERVAASIARPMTFASQCARPAVWVLRMSTEAILRPLGLAGVREATISEDEVKSLIAEGTRAGIFLPREREMIDGVLRLADRSVRVIMTPRRDVVWVNADADRAEIARTIGGCHVTRIPVCDGSLDRVLGMVHTKDLLAQALEAGTLDVGGAMTNVVVAAEDTSILGLLDRLRRDHVHMAVVVDAHGVTEGVVTLSDVLESIAGEFPGMDDDEENAIVERADGSWLVNGTLPLDVLEERLKLPGMKDEAGFVTVAGFVLHHSGRLPRVGETFTYRGIRFEVVDMDGRRVDKVLVQPETGETVDAGS